MMYMTIGDTVYKDCKPFLVCSSYRQAKQQTNALNKDELRRRIEAEDVKKDADE